MTNFIPYHDYYKVGKNTWTFYGLRFPGCFKDLYVKIEIMTKFMLLTVKNLLWKKTSTTYSYY